MANYEFLGNKCVLPLAATWLVTVPGEGKELSRLLVRSVSDFSSILEEMAFSKKSFDAIFSLTEAAAWWCPAQPGLLLSQYLPPLSSLLYPQQTQGFSSGRPQLSVNSLDSQFLKHQQHCNCTVIREINLHHKQ